MFINTAIFVLIVVLAVVIGSLVGVLFERSRAGDSLRVAELGRAEAVSRLGAAEARAQLLAEENDELLERTAGNNQLLQALAPLAKQVDQVNTQIRSLEMKQEANAAKLATQMANDARTSAELARTTSGLKAALQSTSARGSWGEVELRRIIEAAGMLERVDFSVQSATSNHSESGSRQRPDITIHLPGGAHVPLDAKVPLSSYLQAQEIDADDLAKAAERENLLKAHSRAVKAHVDALAKRNYPDNFPGSPQLTVMFLPSEGLLAEAVDRDVTLLEYAFGKGIVPASPVSLLALLRSIAAVWSSTAATEEAREIANLGRSLVDRLNIFSGHLSGLGSNLQSAVGNYNKAVGSLERRVLSQARKFESLGDVTSAPEIEMPDGGVRGLTIA